MGVKERQNPIMIQNGPHPNMYNKQQMNQFTVQAQNVNQQNQNTAPQQSLPMVSQLTPSDRAGHWTALLELGTINVMMYGIQGYGITFYYVQDFLEAVNKNKTKN